MIFKYYTTVQRLVDANLYPFGYRGFEGSVGVITNWMTNWVKFG
jgi:hypothetical protein